MCPNDHDSKKCRVITFTYILCCDGVRLHCSLTVARHLIFELTRINFGPLRPPEHSRGPTEPFLAGAHAAASRRYWKQVSFKPM